MRRRTEARHSRACASAAISTSAFARSEARNSRSTGCCRLPVLGAAGGNTGAVVQPANIAHKAKAQVERRSHLDRWLFRPSLCFDMRRATICARLMQQMFPKLFDYTPTCSRPRPASRRVRRTEGSAIPHVVEEVGRETECQQPAGRGRSAARAPPRHRNGQATPSHPHRAVRNGRGVAAARTS